MVKRLQRIGLLLLVAMFIIAGYQDPAHALPTGFTGRTLLTSTLGCGSCHGSSANTGVQATITGPTVVPPGQSATFTIKVTVGTSTSTTAGVDIAVSAGSLSPISTQLQLSGGEITHNTPLARGTVYSFTYTAPASGGPVTMYATVAGAANSWNWATNTIIDLPVQLSSFTGIAISSQLVQLDWRTLSEVNNYGFYVQKRRAGVADWSEVLNSFIRGNGTTNEPHNYVFMDRTASTGSWQYRLRQVDLDQSEHFTEPIGVSVLTSVNEQAPAVFVLMQNYPNPFNPETNIKFSVETTDRATVEIYNPLGQRVATLFDDVAEAGYYYKLKFSGQNLASGLYFYRLQSGKRQDLKTLLLLK